MTQKRKLPVQTLDIPKRKSSRLAAKSIKSIPKSKQIVYEKLTLKLADDGHAVYVELIKDPETSEEWEFEPTKEGYKVRSLQKNSEKQVKGISSIQAAVRLFVCILKTPDLHLKHLFIDLESPESICRKLEAARKMFHPEDKKFKCTPPEFIKKLYKDNSESLLRLLDNELKSFNFKLSVECFEMEFDGFPYQIQPVLSALQPTKLKKIGINSDCLYSEDNELVNLEQWKRAGQLECFSETSMNVKHWKHFKCVDIALGLLDKEELDEILKTFLFLSTWEQISMQFRNYRVRRDEYFKNLDIPATTVTPGIGDNWVIEVPAMNHRVYVIFSEGTLHLFRKHWIANREKKVAVKRKFRKSEAVLSELPDVLARHIVEQLDEMSKQSLRQTCRFFNHIVNTTASTYEKLTLTLADNRSAIFIELFIDAENRLELEFEQDPLGYTVKNPQEGWEQTVIYTQYRHGLERQFDFIGGAVNHFLKIFTKKTVVKKLCLVTEDPIEVFHSAQRNERLDDTIDCYQESYSQNVICLKKTLMNLLAEKQHSLKVQHFDCRFGDTSDDLDCEFDDVYHHMLHVLKFLDPMVLEKISINGRLSEEESEKVGKLQSWKGVKEFNCSQGIPESLWSHFSKVQIFIKCFYGEKMEEIYQTLLNSTNWNNVLLTCRKVGYLAKRFLNQLEDQRPVESRVINSKLIRIPNIPNQFINYQLINNNISFTRVIQ